MKITKIEQQVKSRGRYSIFIDDKFAFGLSEIGLIDSGLKVGQEVSKDELGKLKKDSKTDKVYNQSLALISGRKRSEWEVKDYIKRKGLGNEESEQILNKLTKARFIDDENFAKAWIENRRLLKNISKKKLKMELRQKRISDEIISTVLADDEASDMDVLKELIAKKRTQTRYQDDLKLMQYLTRQGFNYQDIKIAMQKGS